MRAALDQAQIALKNGWIPVGSVFVMDKNIIGYGAKSGMRHAVFDHAEHNGCYQLLWDRHGTNNLRGCEVFSTLEPCIMCMALLMKTRVSRIVYALEDPYGGGSCILSGSLPAQFQQEHPSVERGPFREESRKLLREFFSQQPRNGLRWTDRENPLIKLVMDE